jgi:RES domain-containing protein
MKVFRIALKKHGATARDALSGISGFSADGRWHSQGRLLDYAAATRSLATLERLVHYKRFSTLAPHVIYEAQIPDAMNEVVRDLPPGWDGPDPLPAAQAIGDAWCDLQRSPALQVPSAVTPGEFNLILNSRHPEWDWNWVSTPSAFEFDGRLVELMAKKPTP